MSAPPAAAPAMAAARWPALVSGLGWALAGHAAGALGLLAGFRLLTGVLPPGVFGAVSLLTALAAFARALAGFPVLQAALRHHPETAGAGRPRLFAAVMRHELARSAVLALAVTAAAGLVARAAYGARLLPFALLGAYLAADLARNFLLDLLNAARQHARYAAFSAAEAWLRPVLGVLAAIALGSAPENVIAGYLVAALVLALALYASSPLRAAAAEEPEDTGAARAELRRSMRGFARPLIPLALFSWLTSVGDRWLLGAWSGAADVGLYAAVYGLASVPFIAAQGVVELALRPLLFAAASAGDRALERRLLAAWTGLSVAAASVGVAAFTLFHRELAALALGPAYRAASPLMRPIALGLGLWLVAAGAERACYAHKRTRLVLAAQGVGAAAFLAVTPPLVLRYGAAGAAMAVPVYFGLQLVAAAAAARSAMRTAP